MKVKIDIDYEEAVKDFKKQFPKRDVIILTCIIEEGVNKFIDNFTLMQDNFIIDSAKHDFIIPINLREKINDTGTMIAHVNKVINKLKRKKVLETVDSHIKKYGYTFEQFHLNDSFSYYTDKEEVITDFEEINI